MSMFYYIEFNLFEFFKKNQLFLFLRKYIYDLTIIKFYLKKKYLFIIHNHLNSVRLLLFVYYFTITILIITTVDKKNYFNVIKIFYAKNYSKKLFVIKVFKSI